MNILLDIALGSAVFAVPVILGLLLTVIMHSIRAIVRFYE